ncbi:MAG: hypothetical protein ACRDDZ_04515 [Marinifilaceae bacterium]
MRKVIYLLMLLAWGACSKDSDSNLIVEPLHDFEKPFSKAPKEELKQTLSKALTENSKHYSETLELMSETSYKLWSVANFYGVSDLMGMPLQTRQQIQTENLTFLKGLKLTWNPQYAKFDTLISSAATMEYILPMTIEDDSKNELSLLYYNVNGRKEFNWKHNGVVILKEAEVIKHHNTPTGPYMSSYFESSLDKYTFIGQSSLDTFSMELLKDGITIVASKDIRSPYDISSCYQYGGIRFHFTIKNYNVLNDLIMEVLDSNVTDAEKEIMITELYKSYCSDNVVVYADKDEKLCDLINIQYKPIEGKHMIQFTVQFEDGEVMTYLVQSLDIVA